MPGGVGGARSGYLTAPIPIVLKVRLWPKVWVQITRCERQQLLHLRPSLDLGECRIVADSGSTVIVTGVMMPIC